MTKYKLNEDWYMKRPRVQVVEYFCSFCDKSAEYSAVSPESNLENYLRNNPTLVKLLACEEHKEQMVFPEMTKCVFKHTIGSDKICNSWVLVRDENLYENRYWCDHHIKLTELVKENIKYDK
jgi:hypothetical protein